MNRTRCVLGAATLALVCACGPGEQGGGEDAATADPEDGGSVADGGLDGGSDAGSVVSGPTRCWPFDRPSVESLRASERKVFLHYFSPFPISIDNDPPETDYYARHYLSPDGEGGMYYYAGGFIKQRPLPQAPRSDVESFERLNLEQEVRRARELGIDGFTFDILSTSGRHWERLLKMLDAAAAVDPDFGIVLMPDMIAEFDGADADAARAEFVAAISSVADHPATHHLDDGRLVIAPFGGERRDAAWWTAALADLAAAGIETAFVPVFVRNWRTTFPDYESVPQLYGIAQNSTPTVSGALGMLETPATVHEHDLIWMQPVSPQDSRPKSLVYTESSHSRTLRQVFDSAIRGGADWIHGMTWNDYSEATEISPSTRTQWVFFDLMAYYVTWFKTGSQPPITRDVLYYFHRIHSVDAEPDLTKQREPYTVHNGTPGVDEIELLAFLTAPGTLEITVGGETDTREVEAGIQSFIVPLREGQPRFRLLRDGAEVVAVESPFVIDDDIVWQDMLYRAGSSASCDREALFPR